MWREFAAVAFGLAFAAAPAWALTIDRFDVGPLAPTIVQGGSPTTEFAQNMLPTDSVLGGQRLVQAWSSGSGEIEVDVAQGRLEFDQLTGFSYLQLSYGLPVSLGADLLADGSDAFRLSFTDTLIQPYHTSGAKRGSYRFSVSDPTTTRLVSVDAAMFALDGQGDILLPFASFLGIDFHNVARIAFDASRIEQGSTINLSEIGTVRTIPEPASGLLFVLGSLLAAGRSKRSTTGRAAKSFGGCHC